MNYFRPFILFLALLLFNSCSNLFCDETFIIKGNVSNATTQKVIGQLELTFIEYEGDFKRIVDTLGSVFTDAQGNYVFAYKCTGDNNNKIQVSSFVGRLRGIVVNQNIEQDLVFQKKLKVNVKMELNKISTKDTVFFAIEQNGVFMFDTIIDPNKMTNENYIISNTTYKLYWGTGSMDFEYDNQLNVMNKFRG